MMGRLAFSACFVAVVCRGEVPGTGLVSVQALALLFPRVCRVSWKMLEDVVLQGLIGWGKRVMYTQKPDVFGLGGTDWKLV